MSRFLNTDGLPTLAEAGFTGGRNNFRTFCRAMFADDDPRFLQTDNGQLVVFRHEDLQAFGTAQEIGNLPIGRLYPARFSNPRSETRPKETLPGGSVADVISSQVFTFNPPLHGPLRQILTGWLGPRQVVVLEDTARHTAHHVADRLSDGDEVDFVTAIAETMTVEFWGAVLGLTCEERDAIGRCTGEMTRLFRLDRSAQDLAILDRAFQQYAGILEDAAQRGLKAGNPMLSAIAEKLAAIPPQIDPLEAGITPRTVGAFLAGNLVDGFHTIALACANTFHVLVNHPQSLAEIRQSPQLMAKAIAEALRLEPPVILLKRYALRDFTYRDRTIEAGSVINMLWAAGNHDPSAFPDPERFDLNRPHVGLTTFGKGIHICPGRHAGVMLIRILLETLEARGLSFIPSSEPSRWLAAHAFNQIAAMPVTVATRKERA